MAGQITLKGIVGNYTVTFRPRIGGGTFGQVYEAVHNVTQKSAAVKEIVFSDTDGRNEFMYNMAERELNIILSLQEHPNVVKLYEHILQKDAFFIFMEYCELKDLKDYLYKNKNIDLLSKVKIMEQTASALAFMHRQKPPVIHRDIKLENILMTRNNGQDVAKLTDFGLSKLCDEQRTAARSTMYVHKKFMTTACGSQFFQAPEFFEEAEGGLKYNATVDTFALGMVFSVLLNFGPENDEILPLSVDSRKSGKVVNIGTEMLVRHRKGEPLPRVAEYTPNDDPNTKQLKRIIIYMTQFRDRDRKNISEVEEELQEVISRLNDGGQNVAALNRKLQVVQLENRRANIALESMLSRLRQANADKSRALAEVESQRTRIEDIEDEKIQVQIQLEETQLLMDQVLSQKKSENNKQPPGNGTLEVAAIHKPNIEFELELIQERLREVQTERYFNPRKEVVERRINHILREISNLRTNPTGQPTKHTERTVWLNSPRHRMAFLCGGETNIHVIDRLLQHVHIHCETCVQLHCKENPDSVRSCEVTQCPLECGARYHSCKSIEHDRLCPKKLQPCVNNGYGCKELILNSARAAHLAKCASSCIAKPHTAFPHININSKDGEEVGDYDHRLWSYCRRDEYSQYIKTYQDLLSLNVDWQEKCPLANRGCNYTYRRFRPGKKGSVLVCDNLQYSIQHQTENTSTREKSYTGENANPRRSSTSKCKALTSLDDAILRHIATFLDGFSLNSLSRTCRAFREVCFSLLREKGVVVQQWNKSMDKGDSKWICTEKWMFSRCFEPVNEWEFEENIPISEHLKVCEFNIRQQRTMPFNDLSANAQVCHSETQKRIWERMYPGMNWTKRT